MTDRPPIDRPALERLLLAVEARAHRDGWDQPATLWVMFDHAADEELDRWMRRVVASKNGPAVTAGPYRAQNFLPHGAFEVRHPPTALRRFCANVVAADDGYEAVDVMRALLCEPAMIGVGFLYESWGRTFATEEEGKRTNSRHRYADMPGSFECRMLTCATVDGRLITAMRKRGSKPEVEHLGEQGGWIPNSLRALAAKMAGETRLDLLKTDEYVAAGYVRDEPES